MYPTIQLNCTIVQLKCTIQRFLVYPELYSHHHNQFQNVFVTPKRSPISFSSHSQFLPTCPALHATFCCCSWHFPAISLAGERIMTILVPGLGTDALKIPGLPAKTETECTFFQYCTVWSLRDVLSLFKQIQASSRDWEQQELTKIIQHIIMLKECAKPNEQKPKVN